MVKEGGEEEEASEIELGSRVIAVASGRESREDWSHERSWPYLSLLRVRKAPNLSNSLIFITVNYSLPPNV
jgi:hypothetical protein